MLGKLLKYDMRSFYKMWITMAITSVIFAVIGGYCSRYAFNVTDSISDLIETVSTIGLFVSFLFFIAFEFASIITVFYRFYQNFYTDEGYLTFTLPTTKNQHLLSKLFFSLIFIFSTSAVLIIDAFIMILIAGGIEPSTVPPEPFNPLWLVYAAEIMVIALAAIVCSILFIFIVISFAAKFSKKMQAIIGVGIFYALSVCSVIITLFMVIISNMGGISWVDLIPEAYGDLALSLLLLTVASFFVSLASVLYFVEYRLLDRHLNLA